MAHAAWLDGVALDATLAASRALNYGDGVFRTLLCWQGKVLDFSRHVAVLQRDCETLHLVCPPQRRLAQAVATAVAGDAATFVVKLTVIRRESGRGYRGGTASRLLVQRSPAPAYPAAWWTRGIIVATSPVQLAEQPLLAGAKHLNRLEQVLASRNWPRGAGEVIICDRQGRPACGTRTNLFWVDSHGALHTPMLALCGVRGMMRDRVLDCAQRGGVPIAVADAVWPALMQSAEAFVTNSLIGIWPLRRLAERRWAAPGPVTRKLAAALGHPRLVKGRDSD
ncbi:MAG: aminodeoxychorismate lyase [Nevskiaceae bacterium]|nr:MAG: aminodeoxychorismate lyase [Nevskiaceae bacterium]TBR74819.1 MAG: aminodeoxychorismate lyase [Nevskiaceae bacterium]